MNTKEFAQLRDRALELIKNDLKGKDLYNFINKSTNIYLLPMNKNVIRTLSGIVNAYSTFGSKILGDAIHDIVECIYDYNKEYYSPRLGKYSSY